MGATPSIIVITCYCTIVIVSPLVRVDSDAEEARVGLQEYRNTEKVCRKDKRVRV